MPVATACLVKLVPDTSVDTFLHSLFSTELRDFVHIASRVVEPVIRPEKLDVTFLNCTKWDLLLFLGPGPHDLLKEGGYKIQAQVQEHYSICCGIPSSIWNNYHKRSAALNKEAKSMPLRSDWSAVSHADYSSVAKDSQNLEASPGLLDFADRLGKTYQGPVSQLNLLHFRPGKEAMESYHKYGKAFAEVASIRGGDAKLVGNVLSPSPAEDSRGRKTFSATQSPDKWALAWRNSGRSE